MQRLTKSNTSIDAPQKTNKLLLIILLGCLSAIAPFSIDTYLPAFAQIAQHLHTSIHKVNLTLSVFLFGVAFGQLFYGPLSDRWGRKKPLFAGLLLFTIASFAASQAEQIETLILFRLFMALGGCVGMVIAMAMVRDLFSVTEMARIFSFLILVTGVAPILAPSIGSLILQYDDWHAIFLFLGLFGLTLLFSTTFLLPETKANDPQVDLNPLAVLKEYYVILNNRHFLIFATIGGFTMAGLFAFITASPTVYMTVYHLPQKQFAFAFGLNASGLILASQATRYLLRYFTPIQLILTTILISLLANIILFIFVLLKVETLSIVMALIFINSSCAGITLPNASAMALAKFKTHAGAASALLGAIRMLLGAIASFCLASLGEKSALPMISLMLFCSAAVVLTWFLGRPHTKAL